MEGRRRVAKEEGGLQRRCIGLRRREGCRGGASGCGGGRACERRGRGMKPSGFFRRRGIDDSSGMEIKFLASWEGMKFPCSMGIWFPREWPFQSYFCTKHRNFISIHFFHSILVPILAYQTLPNSNCNQSDWSSNTILLFHFVIPFVL